MRSAPRLFFLLCLLGLAFPQTNKPAPKPVPFKPSAEDVSGIASKLAELDGSLSTLSGKPIDPELVADASVCRKAVQYLLRFSNEEFFSARTVPEAHKVLDLGLARARELAQGRAPWMDRKGSLVRAYRSRVDGSLQPYAVIIPASYDGKKPLRLDVVLHGRGATLSEVNFMAARETTNAAPTNLDSLRLEVYGRWNNAYRYAGEADVFEAIQSVASRYRVDEKRLVLRGFSMGGAGAWHLGLHHPGTWAAVEAGAGFTETVRYARLSNIPPQEARVLPWLDAMPVALNASATPFVAYSGEDDKAMAGLDNMREQLTAEGLKILPDGLGSKTPDIDMVFLVGPKTGHKWHPETLAQSEAFLARAANAGLQSPDRVRFVVYHLRYNKCHWLTVEGLAAHYARGDVDARRSDGGRRVDLTTHGVTRLSLDVKTPLKLSVDGQELAVPALKGPVRLARSDVAGRSGGAKDSVNASAAISAWVLDGGKTAPEGLAKIHGLTGPIDDAFLEPFVCVTPTATAANAAMQAAALKRQERFAFEFAKWLRGDVPVKRDGDITPDDIRDRNLIVFGDPAGNRILAQVAGKLPIQWTREKITVGGKSYEASRHLLVMIYPNPLNPKKYLVVNSGHTFGEKEWRASNALQYSRLGDWAILSIETDTAGKTVETVAASGFFDERWGLSGP